MGFSFKNLLSKAKEHAGVVAPYAATAMFPGGSVAAPMAMQLLKKAQQQHAASEESAPEEHGEDSLQSLAGCCGEEELELARSGGLAERQSLQRRRGRVSTLGSEAIPHEMYRAAVWQRAKKMAGGGVPQAKHVFQAQRTVDRDLQRKGTSIRIPGARPGRVTR